MKRRTLTTMDLMRRSPPFSGPIQVDAAVVVEAVAKVDGGGRARALRRREVEDRDEEARGESEEGPLALFIRLKG